MDEPLTPNAARAPSPAATTESCILNNVPSYKHPGDARRLILATADTAAAIELAPEHREER
jgi:hypothetical protein